MRSEAAANQALGEMVGRYPARPMNRKPARRAHVVTRAPLVTLHDACVIGLMACGIVAFMLGR